MEHRVKEGMHVDLAWMWVGSMLERGVVWVCTVFLSCACEQVWVDTVG